MSNSERIAKLVAAGNLERAQGRLIRLASAGLPPTLADEVAQLVRDIQDYKERNQLREVA